MRSARERMTDVVEKWFLVEPLLFAVWTMHEVVPDARVRTIRVRRGRVEYNPQFIDSLPRSDLQQTLTVEALRMLLKHPYSRRRENAELAYAASNITLQEYLDTSLPLPRARDVFDDEQFDKQYYEFYYHKLVEQLASGTGPPAALGPDDGVRNTASDESPAARLLDVYANVWLSGRENTEDWDADELLADEINDRIRAAAESDAWGTTPGRWKERLLASLHPPLNYRAVLRHFRASVLSVHRRLTRMKPNRRYGFQYLGSRYDFTTRLLFAVDVSGSMSSHDLRLGFSVVNRFFKHGLQAIDVVQFDTELKGEPMTLKRARREVKVTGRGGTSFTPVMEWLNEHRDYDGAIIFTDGYAPVPERPKSQRTRVLWLFNREETYRRMHRPLRGIGRATFLKEAKRHR
jgi:predicted metal-dependent peptidase